MAYNGRRAPNVSQYIATLNMTPTAQELAAQSSSEAFNLEEDLAMFTNTQFFDFDLGQDANLQPVDFELDGVAHGQMRGGDAPAAVGQANDGLKDLDFIQGMLMAGASYGSFPTSLLHVYLPRLSAASIIHVCFRCLFSMSISRSIDHIYVMRVLSWFRSRPKRHFLWPHWSSIVLRI